MYRDREGAFEYSIRRRTFRSGKTVWHWEVRRLTDNAFLKAGVSLRSHDAAKTAAFEAVLVAERALEPAPLSLAAKHLPVRQRGRDVPTVTGPNPDYATLLGMSVKDRRHQTLSTVPVARWRVRANA